MHISAAFAASPPCPPGGPPLPDRGAFTRAIPETGVAGLPGGRDPPHPRRAVLGGAALAALGAVVPGARAGTDAASLRSDYNRYSAGYDDLDGGAAADALGFADLRRALLALARGDVLETAIGTGLNLPQYPRGGEVGALTGLDVSEGMLGQAERKAPGAPFPVTLVRGDVAAMPFPDAAFDTVVDTFSLCVFPDPAAAVREMARVLRPGGSLLLLEHTRSALPLLGAYQDATAGPVAATGKGCVWNQDVRALVAAAGLEVRRCDPVLLGTVSTIVATKR